MKRWLIAVCLLLAPNSTFAAAGIFGPAYVSLFGGWLTEQDMVHRLETLTATDPNTPTFVSRGQVHFDDDWLVGMAFGQVIDKMVRYETEFSFRQHQIDEWLITVLPGAITQPTAAEIAKMSEPVMVTYIVNVFLDISGLVPYFTPFVGAGMGGAYAHLRPSQVRQLVDQTRDLLLASAEWVLPGGFSAADLEMTTSYSDNQWVYQLIGGFRIIEDHWYTSSIFFRYFSTLSPFKFELYDFPDDGLGGVNRTNLLTLYTHVHAYSLEFSFGWFIY